MAGVAGDCGTRAVLGHAQMQNVISLLIATVVAVGLWGLFKPSE